MADPPLVLVVDDEQSYRDALTVALHREGFLVETAADGVEALEKFERSRPAVILLDVMLPRVSGIDVCRQIRDHVAGADHHGHGQGLGDRRGRRARGRRRRLRHQAVPAARARRPRARPRCGAATSPRRCSNARTSSRSATCSSTSSRHEVTVRGELVALPLKEFELLELLLLNAGRVLTRDVLIDRIWGPNYFGDTKTLDVHVKRLRAKVEDDPSNPTRIVTVRGVGYRYEKPTPTAARAAAADAQRGSRSSSIDVDAVEPRRSCRAAGRSTAAAAGRGRRARPRRR